MSLYAHKLVYETALKMAEAVYEIYMAKVNPEYRAWKDANPGLSGDSLGRAWAAKAAPQYFAQARATLAGMLQRQLPEELKQQIADALILDAQFEPARSKAQRRKLRNLTGQIVHQKSIH